jgi:hypothetical protein
MENCRMIAPAKMNEDLAFKLKLYADEICAVNAASIRGQGTVSWASSTALLSQFTVEQLKNPDITRKLMLLQIKAIVEHPQVYRTR